MSYLDQSLDYLTELFHRLVDGATGGNGPVSNEGATGNESATGNEGATGHEPMNDPAIESQEMTIENQEINTWLQNLLAPM